MIQPLPTINQVLIVSGVSAVPVSQGGTGLTTLTANRLLVGNGSSVALDLAEVLPACAGRSLTVLFTRDDLVIAAFANLDGVYSGRADWYRLT